MTRPLVTVITATYHWPRALHFAIQSALAQTMADFEYIVAGDHCTDDTEAVVASFNDPRLKWFNLPENTGNQADVYVATLPLAQGRVVAYLNHDDLWFPEHLETICEPLLQRDLDVVSTLALSIKPPGQHFRQVLGLPHVDRNSGQFHLYPMTTNVAHARDAGEAVGGWRAWRSTREVPTQEFFRRLRTHRHRFAVVPRVTSLKFHSGDRRNSYRIKSADEQAHWYGQMKANPDLRHEQMAQAMACTSLREVNPVLATPTRPIDAPPGWQIEQWRRLRGLDPMMDLGATEPPPSDAGLAPPGAETYLDAQDCALPIVDSTRWQRPLTEP